MTLNIITLSTVGIIKLSTAALSITVLSVTALSIIRLSVMTLSITKLSTTTFNVTKNRIMTLCITKVSINTVSIMPFGIITLSVVTLNKITLRIITVRTTAISITINDTQTKIQPCGTHYNLTQNNKAQYKATQHDDICNTPRMNGFPFRPSVIMLNVVAPKTCSIIIKFCHNGVKTDLFQCMNLWLFEQCTKVMTVSWPARW
jgi:hypothetical protein